MDAAGDAPPTDAPWTCDRIRDAWSAIVEALDRTCSMPSDCEVVDDTYGETCSGTLTIGGCEIFAATRGGYARTPGPALASEFFARCDEKRWHVFDCAPPTSVDCVDGTCRAAPGSCFGDGGP